MTKHGACKSAILAAFLLYALSPLTHTPAGGTPAPFAAQGTSVRGATLYLLEVLYEAFTQPDQDPDDQPIPDRVLVKKKKACCRGRYDLCRSAKQNNFPPPAEPTRPDPHFTAATAGVAPTLLGKSNGTLPVTSGLSPPVLS